MGGGKPPSHYVYDAVRTSVHGDPLSLGRLVSDAGVVQGSVEHHDGKRQDVGGGPAIL